MASVFFRTITIYIVLSFTLRIMGKRQIGELQLAELVSTFILSEIAATPIINTDLPLSYALISVCLIVSLEIIVTYSKNKSPLLKKLFESRPNIIIDKGQLCQGELRRLRISLEELLSELRLQGVDEIADVRYALVEPNGKLSIILNADAKPPTCGDLGLTPEETGISYALITDGRINERNLSRSSWDEKRLKSHLKKRRLEQADVFLMMVNEADRVTIIERSDEQE